MDFQIGDKVIDLAKGPGVVAFLDYEDPAYPVRVQFVNGDDDIYTEDGREYISDVRPSLYHEGTEINIKPAQPNRYPWVNIYVVNGKTVISVKRESKESSLAEISSNPDWNYVDTIQLKPKEE